MWTCYIPNKLACQAGLQGYGRGPLPPTTPTSATKTCPSAASRAPRATPYRHIIHKNDPHAKPDFMVKVLDHISTLPPSGGPVKPTWLDLFSPAIQEQTWILLKNRKSVAQECCCEKMHVINGNEL